MTDPADLDLAQAARALSSKALSAVELTEACLARAHRLEPLLRAFTCLDESGARTQAEVAADDLARGNLRGPLHGVPVAIKDLIDVADLATTASSRVLAGNIARHDAPIVARLRAGGAVVLGKTNTQEFAYGVVTAPTRNPWDASRIPGGSSGGSAVAVASGMALGALGSDTAGSIRIPASLCGVSGLRPRRDSLPMEGIIPLSWTLDSCGPLARTAADLDIMWRVLSGSGPVSAGAEGLRLATPAWGALGELDAEVGDAVEQAVAVFGGAGGTRTEVSLPRFDLWDGPRNIFLASEALAAHQEAGWYPQKASAYGSETLSSLRHAETISASELVAARRTLESLAQRWFAVLRDADLLVLPTTLIPAPRIDELAAMKGVNFRPEVVVKLTRLCGPVNWCDLAAVSIPCGFTMAGLPIGVQLVARDEATALGAALSYQAVTDFHRLRPPLTEPG